MREDKNDYSINLNSDSNNPNFKIKETAEENNKIYNPLDANIIKIKEIKDKINEKIYNPPDINKINVEENKNKKDAPPDINKIKVEENLNKKDEKEKTLLPPNVIEIQEKILGKNNEKNNEKNDEDKGVLENSFYQFFNCTAEIEYFVNLVLVLRKGKKIVMNLFAELRKYRILEFYVSKPERILFEKVLILYKEQLQRDREKILQNLKEGKDINYLYENSDDNNNDEVPDEDTYNEIIEILANVKIETVYDDNNEFDLIQDVRIDDKFRKILNIEITQEKLDKVINILDKYDKNKKNSTDNNNKNINSSETLCGTLYNVCFKKAERSYYEGLNLHAGFIYYIIQNFIFLSSFIGITKSNGMGDSIGWIYAMIILLLCAVYIFRKLFFKKYDENFTKNDFWIFFHLFNLLSLKFFMYIILYLILQDTILDPKPGNVFIGFFAVKNVFLIYCTVYFFARDGLISYVTLTFFGIVILIISALISMIYLFLKDVLIQFIMSVVGMIFFHIGMNVARCKEALFVNKKLWNTLSIEVFQLTVILFPAMIITIIVLICLTFGYCISSLIR